MGMREKLIELLCKAHNAVTDKCIENGTWSKWGMTYAEQIEIEADSLFANGVTIPVRCKDCKNRDEIAGECKHPKAVGWDVLIPDDNDFCSYGERRTDDENGNTTDH